MNKSPQYNQQAEPEKRRSELEGVWVCMYLSKPGNWTSKHLKLDIMN